MSYRVADYGSMMSDGLRMRAYADALADAVRPGSVVVDVGAGTGVMALLACRYGARKVYAIEPNRGIFLGRELARANGFADRIEFIHDVSTAVRLPEPADVLVSDLRGTMPLYHRHIETIVDARQRFLAPGGAQIPERDRIWFALLDDAEAHDQVFQDWKDPALGFDLAPALALAGHDWQRHTPKPEAIFGEPACVIEVDYRTVTEALVRGRVRFTVPERRTGHGFVAWFDAQIHGAHGYSTRPDGVKKTVYGNGYFPWLEPVTLEPGDEVQVDVTVRGSDDDYIWRWQTSFERGGRRFRTFDQSTFLAEPLPAVDSLRAWAKDRTVDLNEGGRVAAFVLPALGEGRALGSIAADLSERFPTAFPTEREALTRVTRLCHEFAVLTPRTV